MFALLIPARIRLFFIHFSKINSTMTPATQSAVPPITWNRVEEEILTRALVSPVNPLLYRFEYTQLERQLIELFSIGVQQHHTELQPGEDRLWLAFSIHDIVRANNYDIVWEALERLMDKKIVGISGQRGSRKNLREQIVSSPRMGEGDAIMCVQIHRLLVPWFLEIAEMPHVRYTLKMRSSYDRALYDLFDALERLPRSAQPVALTVAGFTDKLMVYPSQKNIGVKNVLVDDFLALINYKGSNAHFKNDVLTRRIKFLNAETDLHVEVTETKTSRKVTGLDIRVARQQVSEPVLPIIDIMLSNGDDSDPCPTAPAPFTLPRHSHLNTFTTCPMSASSTSR